jgi:hypothetical protein
MSKIIMTKIRKTKKALKKQLVSKKKQNHYKDINTKPTTIGGESLRGIFA